MENLEEKLKSFNPELKKAFVKMVLGVNVQITKECREKWGKENLGRWFFIQNISADEKLTICGVNHDIYEGISLNDV